jgi:hypothetical protein
MSGRTYENGVLLWEQDKDRIFSLNYLYVNRRFQVTPNKMQRFLIHLFIYKEAVRVSGRSSVHYQEHKTAQTASRIVNQYCCYLLS